MTVVRRHHNGDFTIIPNRMLEDRRLSIEAKGLLCWLISRPNDWSFKLALIGPLLGIGRDKTERLFRELIEVGFVDRIQERNDGRWGPVEYCVFDNPQSFAKQKTAPAPVPEKPVPEKPVPANQGALIKRKDTKTERYQNAADDAGAREPVKSLITPEAFALCDDLMRLQHLDTADPRCIGAAYEVQAWLTKGWHADTVRQAVETVMARRADAPRSLRYFEGAIAQTHLDRNRALPVGIPCQSTSTPAPRSKPLTEFQRGRKETQEILNDLENFAARSGPSCAQDTRLLPRNPR